LTIWKPDSCDCVLEFNEKIKWIESHNNCRLHQSLKGQNHLDSVIAQNQRFNLSLGNQKLNEEEERILFLSKNINKLKIRTGDFSENIPDKIIEMKTTFWENIRSRLTF